MKVYLRFLMMWICVGLLSACGGGGGSISRDATPANPNTPTTSEISVTLQVTNLDGSTAGTLASNNPLLVTATVRENGNPLSGRTVTFDFANTALNLASFASNGSATTNAEGVAQLQLNVGEDAGSTEITASLSTGETSSPVAFTSAGIVVAQPPTLSVAVTITNQDGSEAGTLAQDNPLTVTATVTDANGTPVVDEEVSFSFSIDGIAVFSTNVPNANTNAQGQAVIGIQVGELSGDGQVIATIGSGESDSQGFSSAGSTAGEEAVANLELVANTLQLPSSGNDEIELIAVVRNQDSALLSGVEVSFSAPLSGGLNILVLDTDGQPLSGSVATTADDGTARARVTTGSNRENRTVIVTATVTSDNQTFTQELPIDVVGSAVDISGASSVIVGDPSPFTLSVVDSDGLPIVNQTIALEVSSGTLSATQVETGNTGQVTVDFTASVSGEAVITASALNAVTSLTVTAQADSFSFTSEAMGEVSLTDSVTLTVTWLREGSPVIGGNVQFATSRGVFGASNIATTTTDASGNASVVLTSNNAGLASISAEGESAGTLVTARSEVEFVATVADTIVVDATPDNIGPDGQTSTITAVVRDPTGNLVKGKTVIFSTENDNTGGSVTPTGTTNASGVASAVYTSLAVSDANSILVRATVDDDISITDVTTLTVGQRAFDISLGTGPLIETPDDETYLKGYAVFVSDVGGRAVENVELTVSAIPLGFAQGGTYRKGFWTYSEDASRWVQTITATCPNEDINGNGLLEVGEDTNGDGLLTPGIIGTVSFAGDSDSVVTDGNGQARVEQRYPRSFGAWTEIVLTVFASSAGTEASQSQLYELSIAAADVTDQSIPPPANPFGQGSVCTDTL